MIDHVLDPRQLTENGDTCVQVIVQSVRGSAPREQGAWMLVGKTGVFQTIGGGHLELHAIDEARKLADSDAQRSNSVSVTLGPESGQCCGGVVTLSFHVLDSDQVHELSDNLEREAKNYPAVYVFGAGHVGRALTNALLPLPVRVVVVDTRETELDGVSDMAEKLLIAMPEAVVRTAEPNSAFVILTHDHGLDFLIAREALLRKDSVYVGLIGSDTKRASFRNWLRREGAGEDDVSRLICPIGSDGLGDKRPEVIAVHVASEISKALFAGGSAEVDINARAIPEKAVP